MSGAGAIMLIDDDPDILGALGQNLELAGYQAICHLSAGPALAALSADFAGIVLSDLRMPQIDGREVLRRVLQIDSQIPVVLMSAHADVGVAMQAMRDGAYDFITKPFDPALLQAALRRASEWRRAVLSNRELSAARNQAVNAAIVAQSAAAQEMLAEIAAAAQTDLPCLISGEAGSGASTAARELHRQGARTDAPLIVIDCPGAALAGAESALFGHASGAFAGATMPRTGDIERANRGTLILDRIDGLPPALQARMIQLIEQHTIVPLGSERARPVKTRCIGIAQLPIGDAALTGANASLLYKFSSTRVRVPPLRERRADIEPLFRQFFAAALAKAPPGAAAPELSAATWAHLTRHDWPGNLSELQAYAQRAAGGGAPPPGRAARETGPADLSLRAQLARYEADVLREALRENGGEARMAAAKLCLPRKTFYERLARHGIVAADFRA